MGTAQIDHFEIVRDGRTFAAGDQNWFPKAYLRKCGCGLTAAADLLLYLRAPDCQTGIFRGIPPGRCIPPEVYDRYAEAFRRRFPPVLPPFGMNAAALWLGVNGCFRAYRLPYRARWGVRPTRLWSEIERMLRQGVPVILCIGPNFPLFWQKHKLTLYVRDGEQVRPAARTAAHFVTVTGIGPEWLRIVSWGKVYYIRKTEYIRYVKEHSNFLLCNILHVHKKAKRPPS